MNKHFPILLGFILLGLAIWVQLTSFAPVNHTLVRLENLAYDLQLRTKIFTQKKMRDSPVVIVDVDDKSLKAEGRWPWPRSKLGEVIEKLKQSGVVVIALDILFPENEINIVNQVLHQLETRFQEPLSLKLQLEKLRPDFDEDKKFANSFKNMDVVLGMTFSPTSITQGHLPQPLLQLNTPILKQLGFMLASGYLSDISELEVAAQNAGFLNVFPDADGIVRRVPLFMRYQDGLYPSLALNAVRLYLLSSVKLLTAKYNDTMRLEGVSLREHTIPTDTESQVIIPFVGDSFTLPYISATDVLHNRVAANSLQGKIVFIGTSAVGLGDLHATAIQGVYPGVEIQASIAYGILMNSFSYRPVWALGSEVFISLLLGLICIFLFPYLGPRTLGLLIIAIPTILIFVNNYIWQQYGLIISILIPVLIPILLAIINIICGFLFETLRRERLKEMFGQYVPEKHIDEMLKASGKNYGLMGEDRQMTVLFADIRNFTTISEPLTASELKDLLNEFFTPMTEIIFKHRGTIDKYVGDLIMAFWGAPLSDKRHAQHAISAALDMQKALLKLQVEFVGRNWPEINIGIGINSGIMSVGDMGSKFRRNYTVLGDEVNLASRVEGLTKFYGVKIIVTENTKNNQKIFIFRLLDKVRVKGKKKGISIYEVIGRFNEITTEKLKEIKLSDDAMENYFQQNWETAKTLFTELHLAYPEVKLYNLFLSRIKEFESNLPSSDWDGIYEHITK